MFKFVITITALFTSLFCGAQYRDVKIGDIVKVNGIAGIVFNVNEDGTHGK